MATTYHKATGPAVDSYSVLKITDDPLYKVIAECAVEADADAIAAALNAT